LQIVARAVAIIVVCQVVIRSSEFFRVRLVLGAVAVDVFEGVCCGHEGGIAKVSCGFGYAVVRDEI